VLTARQVFWLSDHSGISRLPTGVLSGSGAKLGLLSLSPITAAGPPRICTGFRDAVAALNIFL